MLQIEYETTIVELLALIYCKINWRKMKTSKNPHDIFNHRVRAAARRATLYEFVSMLCNYFGLQSLPANAQQHIDILRENEQEVLNTLSSEHIPYCVRAIIRAKEIKTLKKEETNESSTEI